MQQILILDDNPITCKELEEMLTKEILPEQSVVRLATTVEAAKQMLQEDIAILFLDIQLNENENGIAFAKQVHDSKPAVKIIFITAYIRYCEDIFDANPAGFLVKPFTVEKVRRALEIAQQASVQEDFLVLELSKNQTIRVELNKIAYIESRSRKLLLCEENGIAVYEFTKKFSEVESQIPSYFWRCHHSFWVNFHHVQEIKRYAFVLKSGFTVPISQQKFKISKAAFSTFLGDSI